MAIATRGSRKIVVGGETFRWSVDGFYDYDRAQFTVASEDRALLVMFTPAMDVLRVVGRRLPGLPPGTRPPVRVLGPRRTPWDMGPAEVAALVAWCLDASIAKEVVAPEPSQPAWWPWRELVTSWMRPPRTQRDAVFALAVETLGAPADEVARRSWCRSTTRPHRRARSMTQVWEALESASLVDASWVAVHRDRVRDPQTALALAADPDGALHAALFAREMAARRGALGHPTGDAIVWTLADDPAPFACDERPGDPWRYVVDEALRASQVAWEEPSRTDDDRQPPRAWAYDDARDAARHALAVAQGLRPIVGTVAPGCSCDAPFDAWPDVFSPLLRVWSLGYGVGAVCADGVQLVTSPL